MNELEKPEIIARLIRSLTAQEIVELRRLLGEEPEEGTAGVGAVIPPNLPLKEDGAEVAFENWPDDYWESQA